MPSFFSLSPRKYQASSCGTSALFLYFLIWSSTFVVSEGLIEAKSFKCQWRLCFSMSLYQRASHMRRDISVAAEASTMNIWVPRSFSGGWRDFEVKKDWCWGYDKPGKGN
jgi:hypothetical protein